MEINKSKETSNYNPRYTNYCRVNGNTPDEQMKIDEENYKGGRMIPFSFFIKNQIDEFRKLRPDCFVCGSLTDHVEFDNYLNALQPLNAWNVDEWINDLIEIISVQIQEKKVSTVVGIKSISNVEIMSLANSKIGDKVFNKYLFAFCGEEYSDKMNSLAVHKIVCDSLFRIVETEMDFEDLLLTNTFE